MRAPADRVARSIPRNGRPSTATPKETKQKRLDFWCAVNVLTGVLFGLCGLLVVVVVVVVVVAVGSRVTRVLIG